jgi:hypothetical protein
MRVKGEEKGVKRTPSKRTRLAMMKLILPSKKASKPAPASLTTTKIE